MKITLLEHAEINEKISTAQNVLCKSHTQKRPSVELNSDRKQEIESKWVTNNTCLCIGEFVADKD